MPHISVLQVVPSDSEIVRACAGGDVATVRRLFTIGKARYYFREPEPDFCEL
jgi:hypothetical protein